LTAALPSSGGPTTAAAAPDSAGQADGVSRAQPAPYAASATAAGPAEVPEPPGGVPDSALGQKVLDDAFAKMDALEKELGKIDPTSSEGAKRMAEITRQLNRLDEMIRVVNEMRRARHEANMAAIENISA
jgi:hypothetical protein